MKSNRSLVIAVASDLFFKKGLANTSMDDVVKESGVSKSNIYYHFSSKEELLVAVLDHRIGQFQENLEAVMHNNELTVTQRMQAVFTSFAEELDGQACAGGCPILSFLAIPLPELKERITRFLHHLRIMVEMTLKQGIDQGEFRADLLIGQTAQLVMASIEGSFMLAEARGDSAVFRHAGEALLHLLQV